MSRIDTAYMIYNKQSSTSIDCWSQSIAIQRAPLNMIAYDRVSRFVNTNTSAATESVPIPTELKCVA